MLFVVFGKKVQDGVRHWMGKYYVISEKNRDFSLRFRKKLLVWILKSKDLLAEKSLQRINLMEFKWSKSYY